MTKREQRLVWILTAVIMALAFSLVAHPLRVDQRISPKTKITVPKPPPQLAAQRKERPPPFPWPWPFPSPADLTPEQQAAQRDLLVWHRVKQM